MIEPRSRRPLELDPATVSAVLNAPLPTPTPAPSTPPFAAHQTVSVVVVTHDNLVFNRLCLESVLELSSCFPVELIVVDNASSDGTVEYLTGLDGQFANVRLLLNQENRGFAPAVNQGLGAATGEILILLNNDTIVPSGAIDRLVAHLHDTSIGLVGPVTNRASNEAQRMVTYRRLGEMVAASQRLSNGGPRPPVDIGVLTMFCVALRRDTFELVGPLDEQFEVGMFEDDDYAARVRRERLRVVLAEDAFVHHFGEASFGKLMPTGEHSAIFERNRERYEAKWGVLWSPHTTHGDPAYITMRDQVRQVIRSLVPEGATVLVVSRGDDELLRVPGRRVWHFPRSSDGGYAGHHPADTADAIAQLQTLQAQGAGYLAFPEPSLWWLHYYEGLQDYLRETYRSLATESPVVVFGPTA